MKHVHCLTQVLDRQKFVGEKNDCTVTAVAIAFGISYEKAHDFMRISGRQFRKGIYFERVMSGPLERGECFGKKIEKIKFPYYEWERQEIYRELRYDSWGSKYMYIKYSPRTNVKQFIKNNPQGTFIVAIDRHVFTIKDSVIFDWKNSQYCEIEYVIKIT
jgi:hypothetical protein